MLSSRSRSDISQPNLRPSATAAAAVDPTVVAAPGYRICPIFAAVFLVSFAFVAGMPLLTSLTSTDCMCASCLIKHIRTKSVTQGFYSYGDWPYESFCGSSESLVSIIGVNVWQIF